MPDPKLFLGNDKKCLSPGGRIDSPDGLIASRRGCYYQANPNERPLARSRQAVFCSSVNYQT
jgi:hypothetical protein